MADKYYDMDAMQAFYNELKNRIQSGGVLSAGTDLKIDNGVISVNTDGTVGDSADMSFVAGSGTYTSGVGAAAFGLKTSAVGSASHAEGCSSKALGDYSHAGGFGTLASGNWTFSFGENSIARENNSISLGQENSSFAKWSFTVGAKNLASGIISHVEGYQNSSFGQAAHAEGYLSVASGNASHAEGAGNTASGSNSHAEGGSTLAQGDVSHAEGFATIAGDSAMHVGGKWNKTSSNAAFVIGNGTDTKRSDAFVVDWKGNTYIGGSISAHAARPQMTLQYTGTLIDEISYSSTNPKLYFSGKNGSNIAEGALVFTYFNQPRRFGTSLQSYYNAGIGGWFGFSMEDGDCSGIGVVADLYSATSSISLTSTGNSAKFSNISATNICATNIGDSNTKFYMTDWNSNDTVFNLVWTNSSNGKLFYTSSAFKIKAKEGTIISPNLSSTNISATNIYNNGASNIGTTTRTVANYITWTSNSGQLQAQQIPSAGSTIIKLSIPSKKTLMFNMNVDIYGGSYMGGGISYYFGLFSGSTNNHSYKTYSAKYSRFTEVTTNTASTDQTYGITFFYTNTGTSTLTLYPYVIKPIEGGGSTAKGTIQCKSCNGVIY